MGEIWIGTSGWHYKHWVGNFYPPRLPGSRMLDYYTKHFDTVEINNTFYRLPSAAAVSWTPEPATQSKETIRATRRTDLMEAISL